MAFRLLHLIQESGNAGTSGQSFRNHVAGAATGVKMSDYKVTGWTWSGEPIDEDELVNAYNNGESFAMSFDLVEGSKGGTLRSQIPYGGSSNRLGSGKISVTPGAGNGYGSSIAITSSNVLSSSTGHSCTVQVTGAANTNVTWNASGWFQGYTEPSAPADANAHTILFTASVNNNTVGESVISWDLVYTLGPFNASLTRNQHSKFKDRAATNADFEFEWHNNSTYTSLHASTRETTKTQSAAYEDITLYMRYRRIGAGSWTNHGPVTFTDPREES